MKRAKANNYRSKLEKGVGADLRAKKVAFEFEPYKIRFTQPAKDRLYTPDFILPNGIIIEAKGWLQRVDRQKHLMIRECNPELDIRFVFKCATNTLEKPSKTTYAQWCDKNGFLWSEKTVPQEWIDE
jgi:hypothetical protein